MKNNIEVGCLCLSIDSYNYGECTANYFVPGGSIFKVYGSPGKTDKTIEDGWSCEFPGMPAPCMIATRHLIRIDNYDASTGTVTTEQEQTA